MRNTIDSSQARYPLEALNTLFISVLSCFAGKANWSYLAMYGIHSTDLYKPQWHVAIPENNDCNSMIRLSSGCVSAELSTAPNFVYCNVVFAKRDTKKSNTNLERAQHTWMILNHQKLA